MNTTSEYARAIAAIAVALAAGALISAFAPPPPMSTIAGLMASSPGHVDSIPIARMNLLCAQDLPTPNALDLHQCASALQPWAKRVQSETHRHWYRFQRNPAEFENSKGFFRMLMLTVVLSEDFGIHYSDQRKAAPSNARADDRFFANPSDVFLPGLLGPDRQGTCSSVPVLYVAIGRELGYPLKLVTTKAHLFVRWDGAGERFNVEATAHGLARFDDDYYRHWPFEVTPAEEAAEGYLKSLTPPEELAVFLCIRGLCLRDNGRLAEAAEAFAAAARLAPGCQGYRVMLAAFQSKIRLQTAAMRPLPTNP